MNYSAQKKNLNGNQFKNLMFFWPCKEILNNFKIQKNNRFSICHEFLSAPRHYLDIVNLDGQNLDGKTRFAKIRTVNNVDDTKIRGHPDFVRPDFGADERGRQYAMKNQIIREQYSYSLTRRKKRLSLVRLHQYAVTQNLDGWPNFGTVLIF